MINHFEEEYMAKYWEYQVKQWENYFEGCHHNLNIIDEEIYNIVLKYNGKILNKDRKSSLALSIIKRNLIDKNPVVSNLRNHIENLDNYANNIPENIEKGSKEYKSAMAKAMKDNVVSLMLVRNQMAQKLGFADYPELILSTQEINKYKLIKLLNDYLDNNLEKTKEIIRKYNISWDSWFGDLDRISCMDKEYDSIQLIQKLLNSLEFENIKDKIKILSNEKGYTGFATAISPDDIRIVVKPLKNINHLRNLFHEIGHAIAEVLNNEHGLFRILPESYNEAMAVSMEYIAAAILLSKSEENIVNELIMIEYTRCAISALYRFELWDSIEQAEGLYIKYYSKLGISVNDPSLWVCDTFRSLDSVYIYSYVLGAVLGEKLTDYLSNSYKNDYKSWGNWLHQNIYIDGSKTVLSEKLL